MDINTVTLWGAICVLAVSNVFFLLEAHKWKKLVAERDEYIKETAATIAALWDGYNG